MPTTSRHCATRDAGRRTSRAKLRALRRALETAQKLVSYFALNPRVRQSGLDGRARLGFGVPTFEPQGERHGDLDPTLPSDRSKHATLFVALELSKATWLVALNSPIADKISEHRIDGGDTAKLLALIEAKRLRAERQLGLPVRVMCCYEAGHDGFWLHRFLIAHSIDNRVLDSASILVDRRARRAKTDRLDAAALLRTLMALDRGEAQVCRMARVPSVEDEDRRRLTRERERLLSERNAHLQRVKGL